jgi:hypothetical protein
VQPALIFLQSISERKVEFPCVAVELRKTVVDLLLEDQYLCVGAEYPHPGRVQPYLGEFFMWEDRFVVW